MKHFTELRPILFGTGVPAIRDAIENYDRSVARLAAAPALRDPGDAEQELLIERRRATVEGRPPTLDRDHVDTAVSAARDARAERDALTASVGDLERLLDAAVWAAGVPMFHALCKAWLDAGCPTDVPDPSPLRTLWTCFGWPGLAEGPAVVLLDRSRAAPFNLYRAELLWPPDPGGRVVYSLAKYRGLHLEAASFWQHALACGAQRKGRGFTVTDDGAIRFPAWKSPGRRPIYRGTPDRIPPGSLVWSGGPHGVTDEELNRGRLLPATYG